MADSDERRKIAILVSIPPGDEGIRRLRGLLKTMLRGFGIRCLAIRPPAETATFGKCGPGTNRTTQQKPTIVDEEHSESANDDAKPVEIGASEEAT